MLLYPSEPPVLSLVGGGVPKSLMLEVHFDNGVVMIAVIIRQWTHHANQYEVATTADAGIVSQQ